MSFVSRMGKFPFTVPPKPIEPALRIKCGSADITDRKHFRNRQQNILIPCTTVTPYPCGFWDGGFGWGTITGVQYSKQTDIWTSCAVAYGKYSQSLLTPGIPLYTVALRLTSFICVRPHQSTACCSFNLQTSPSQSCFSTL